ncbi:MAG: hypothetical protein H6730_17925 [Deltaproteobacteria bacterium]|nr:hypothetical protein [Deltaproteobacteria bacterium]
MRRLLWGAAVLGLVVVAAWALSRPAEAPSPTAVADPRPPVAAPSPPPARAPAPVVRPPAAAPVPPTESASVAAHRALVRSSLESALRDGLGRDPSPGELDAMTDAALRMRAAQDRLRRLRGDPSEGGERKRLVDEVAQAGADFQTQAGVPLSELTEQVGGGLTTEGATDEVVIAPLEPAP